MGSERRRLLIDTDTASDDAAALAMALRYPGVSVEAITVVGGNVPLDRGVQNALYTVELTAPPGTCNPPVYAGCRGPLLRPLRTAEQVHGHDGMGDIGLPLTGRTPTPGHAVDAIIACIETHPHEVTVVTLGPLTNLAVAITRAPHIIPLIPRVVVMGGQGAGPGNTTPMAEFNLWVDPEAAAIVVRSGLPLDIVGWDVCRTGGLVTGTDQQRLRAVGPVGAFAMDINATLDRYARQHSGIDGFDFADPVAMAVALEPQLATFARLGVSVLWGEQAAHGHLMVDWLGSDDVDAAWAAPNAASAANVCTSVDRHGFLDLLARCYAP
jgi:purine nucleosidase